MTDASQGEILGLCTCNRDIQAEELRKLQYQKTIDRFGYLEFTGKCYN